MSPAHHSPVARPGALGQSVVVVGAGGNIGSQLVPHLARLPGLARLILIDRDDYEEKNRASQAILPRDSGQGKALVQKRRCDRIKLDSSLQVHAIRSPVEDVPLGWLAGGGIVSCLDSRSARQYVNEAAWRLGVPWVDAAVDAAGLLCRVNVYQPGAAAPCLECAWSPQDTAALESEYPCRKGRAVSTATDAPTSLGAVAAGLAATECQKVLAGDWTHAARSRQVLLDLRRHRHYVTRYDRNPNCRFDHKQWRIERMDVPPARVTVGQFFAKVSGPSAREPAIGVVGHPFVRSLACPRCGGPARQFLCLEHRIPASRALCPGCGGRLTSFGFDMLDWLPQAALSSRAKRRSLRSLGFRAGDVVTVRTERGQRHVLLDSGDSAEAMFHSAGAMFH